jgi:membrane protein
LPQQISYLKLFTLIFRKAYKKFSSQDPLLLASSTSFFTIFALAPIILIIIQVLGVIVPRYQVKDEVENILKTYLGRATNEQIINTLTAFHSIATSILITIFGSLFLVFVATNLLRIIKTSLNHLWSVKKAGNQSIGSGFATTVKMLLLILLAGFLLVFGLAGENIQSFIGEGTRHSFPILWFYFKGAVHYLFSIAITTIWFCTMFRYLPDVRPTWKSVFAGGLFTSLLFNIGKIILHALLVKGHLKSFYGASASVVLLMLFVFYISLIFYFGASFTIEWARYHKQTSRLLPHARFYKVVEIPAEEANGNG